MLPSNQDLHSHTTCTTAARESLATLRSHIRLALLAEEVCAHAKAMAPQGAAALLSPVATGGVDQYEAVMKPLQVRVCVYAC